MLHSSSIPLPFRSRPSGGSHSRIDHRKAARAVCGDTCSGLPASNSVADPPFRLGGYLLRHARQSLSNSVADPPFRLGCAPADRLVCPCSRACALSGRSTCKTAAKSWIPSFRSSSSFSSLSSVGPVRPPHSPLPPSSSPTLEHFPVLQHFPLPSFFTIPCSLSQILTAAFRATITNLPSPSVVPCTLPFSSSPILHPSPPHPALLS
jgi:hypothetical protein